MQGKIGREDIADLCVHLLTDKVARNTTFEVKSTLPFSEPWEGSGGRKVPRATTGRRSSPRPASSKESPAAPWMVSTRVLCPRLRRSRGSLSACEQQTACAPVPDRHSRRARCQHVSPKGHGISSGVASSVSAAAVRGRARLHRRLGSGTSFSSFVLQRRSPAVMPFCMAPRAAASALSTQPVSVSTEAASRRRCQRHARTVLKAQVLSLGSWPAL